MSIIKCPFCQGFTSENPGNVSQHINSTHHGASYTSKFTIPGSIQESTAKYEKGSKKVISKPEEEEDINDVEF